MSKKGVVVIGLSYEPEDKVGPHIKNDKTPFIIGAGTKSTNDAYGVPGYPTFFVIDPQGTIQYKGHSFTEAKKSIDETMKKTPPKPGGALAEENAKGELASAEKLLKKKDYGKAIKALEEIVKDYGDTASGKKAKTKLDGLEKDKAIMARIRDDEAKKKCLGWLDMARSLKKNGKSDGARKYYQRIIDQYGDTRYAATARKEMADL